MFFPPLISNSLRPAKNKYMTTNREIFFFAVIASWVSLKTYKDISPPFSFYFSIAKILVIQMAQGKIIKAPKNVANDVSTIIVIPLRKYIRKARNDSNNIFDVSEKIGDGTKYK